MEYVRTLLRVMPKSCKLLRYDYGSPGNCYSATLLCGIDPLMYLSSIDNVCWVYIYSGFLCTLVEFKLETVMGKSQIPILHINLKSFSLESQIPWPKSKPQLPISKLKIPIKSQFFHKYINMNYDLYNREGN